MGFRFMIITRTPFRISIGGGGTDLPSYYEQYGGMLISAAINRYVYISLHNRTFTPDYVIKYSQIERTQTAEEIKHRIIREVFLKHNIEPGIEMVSVADIPAGTGLGSSGSFTVGLLKAVHAFKRQHITAHNLAAEACEIEIDRLKEPIGKQDQYIASFGGLSCMTFQRNGRVEVSPLQVSNETLHDLEDNLLMFFTGYSRSASEVLQDQKKRTEKQDQSMVENLHFIKEIGIKIKEQLESGDVFGYAQSMHEHWLHKKQRSKGISNQHINDWYDLARENGAIGGKLIGAGGGGFLLFYAEDKNRLRQVMRDQGLQEVRFFFDQDGSKVIVRE